MEMSTASDGWQAASIKYRKIVEKLEAEIAALREVMTCGHPRACWQAVKPDSVDAVVGYRCVACEHERLAVAAALQCAASGGGNSDQAS